ncbi:hypothetical protein [Pararhodobacter sp. SW119]|nr:hypothetical protein [Pararhodobacter sp. SW119]
MVLQEDSLHAHRISFPQGLEVIQFPGVKRRTAANVQIHCSFQKQLDSLF